MAQRNSSVDEKAEVVDLDTHKRRNRWDDVINAAVEVFWQQGYSASRVQEVADGVGVLKGSLYHYIRTKEDLLFQIVEDVHRESREILAEAQTLDVAPLERLRTYIERHLLWFLNNYKEVSVYFNDWRFLTGDRFEQALEYRRSYDRIIRRMIAEAQGSGEIHPGVNARYAAFFLHTAINGVPEWYQPEGPDSPATVAAEYAALAVATLRGWRPAGPAPESQLPTDDDRDGATAPLEPRGPTDTGSTATRP